MQFAKLAALLGAAFASTAVAQRPTNTSICDYYTTALLKNNTADNQYTLLKLLVNTVAIGNYTQPNHNAVPGILAPGTYNGQHVNLAPYFTGALKSTNRNGMAVSVNFLDGGGATPLMNNSLPAAGSNQYFLVTHLYQYFGALLGCSGQGSMGFPAYQGAASQYQVHRFMDLNPAQMGYFIQQVALAAQSFGVAMDDITAVGTSLNNLFNYRCSPATVVIKTQGAQLQSMCQDVSCPLDPKATCDALPDKGMPAAPVYVNGTSVGNSTSSGSASTTRGSSPTPMSPTSTGGRTLSTGAAAQVVVNAGAVVGGALALALAL